jgi:hypothetical protein
VMRRTSRSRADMAESGPASAANSLTDEIAQLRDLDLAGLNVRWRNHVGGEPPGRLPKFLLVRMIASRLQENAYGGLPESAQRLLERLSGPDGLSSIELIPPVSAQLGLRPGTLLTREWKGELHRVLVLERSFAWNGATYKSLSEVARAITATRWSGPKFFGLAAAKTGAASGLSDHPSRGARIRSDRRRRGRDTDAAPPAEYVSTASARAAGDGP